MGVNATTSVPVYADGEILEASRLNVTNSGIPVFATTTTRDAAFGGTGEKVLAEGQFAFIETNDVFQYYNGSSWVDLVQQVAVFNETQTSGTLSGTATGGSFAKRTLNTTVGNTITGCSISSSVITLPAGTYLVNAYGPTYVTNRTKLKLRNTTDSTDTLIGTSEFVQSGSSNAATATLQGMFTISASKNFELQQYFQTTSNNEGLGVATSASVSEIYASIRIEKIS
jgi:hypothetical protein